MGLSSHVLIFIANFNHHFFVYGTTETCPSSCNQQNKEKCAIMLFYFMRLEMEVAKETKIVRPVYIIHFLHIP